MTARQSTKWWLLFALLICLPTFSSATIHNIDVDDFFFTPTNTVVAPGDTVRWNWVGSIPHSTTSDVGSAKTWDSGVLGNGSTFDVVFLVSDADGPYPYHCTPHPSMQDTIWVQSPSSSVHEITIGNSFFSPLGTVVGPGDIVRWTFAGGVPHSTTSDPSSPKSWDSGVTTVGGTTFEISFTGSDPAGPYPYRCSVHNLSMLDTIWLELPSTGCCGEFTGGFTGNTDCDIEGKRNLADITRLIDHVYLSKEPLCCAENGNTDGDAEAKINLADITKLIDHVYISKGETAACI